MLIYVLLILILSILCLCNNKKWTCAVSFILLLFVGGFRDSSVGTDTANYLMLFESYGDNIGGQWHANEPLYLLLQIISVYFNWGFKGLQFISMFILLTCFFYYISKNSTNPQYSITCFVLLYFYFNSFNITRQFLAIPFTLLSYSYILIGKWKKSLVLMGIAIMFHYSAIICIIPILIRNYKFPKHILIISLFTTFLVGLTPIAQNVVSSLLHTSSSFDMEDSRESVFSISRLLINIYALYLLNCLKNENNYLTIFVIGICFLNILSFHPVIGRIAQYFTIIQIIIIPNIPLLTIKTKDTSHLKISSFIYMFVTWIYLISSNVGEVVPWKFGGFSFN